MPPAPERIVPEGSESVCSVPSDPSISTSVSVLIAANSDGRSIRTDGVAGVL